MEKAHRARIKTRQTKAIAGIDATAALFGNTTVIDAASVGVIDITAIGSEETAIEHASGDTAEESAGV